MRFFRDRYYPGITTAAGAQNITGSLTGTPSLLRNISANFDCARHLSLGSLLDPRAISEEDVSLDSFTRAG
jgi:hypothetical protein